MEFLPLQFAALKLFGQLVNLKDRSKLLDAEFQKENDEFYTYVLHLIIAAGGTLRVEID